MKQPKIYISLLFALLFSLFAHGQNTVIPDSEFESLLIFKGFDTGTPDGVVPTANINTISILYLGGPYTITDITGIADFTALTHLNCEDQQISTLDLSQNPGLQILEARNNGLSSIAFHPSSALEHLSVNNNQLSTLDVTMLANLDYLYCRTNGLTALDVSQNPLLDRLSVGDNNLSVLNLSQNTALTYLRADLNQLTSLDLSQNTALTIINVADNQLTDLQVSTIAGLNQLYFKNNLIDSIDIRQNPALLGVSATNNLLSTLDVTQNPALENLNCEENQLTELDVRQNGALTNLGCDDNQLTELNLSQNSLLTMLFCSNNQLLCLNLKNGATSDLLLFNAMNNPSLACIDVDDAAWANANLNFNVDPGTAFSTACSPGCILSLVENELSDFKLYPNPSKGTVTLDFETTVSNAQLKIINSVGQMVYTATVSNVVQCNLPLNHSSGLYFIEVVVDGKLFKRKKLVLQ